MRKTFLFVSAVAALCGSCFGDDVHFLETASAKLGISLRHGHVTCFRTTNGIDFLRKTSEMFSLVLTRPDDISRRETVFPSSAKRFRHEKLADGIRLVWEDLAGKVVRVECTVRVSRDDGKFRFGISYEPAAGWAVENTTYPRLQLSDKIGGSAEDDRLLSGEAWGGVIHAPGADPAKRTLVYRTQPGNLAVQAALWWDPSALFYFAAEDDKGDVKHLFIYRGKDDTITFGWKRLGFDTAATKLDYDYTMAAVCGTPSSPVTWHDGAELYRGWARGTRFCAVPTARRKDLPSWLASAPANTLFKRDWFDDPGLIRRWVKEHYVRIAPGVPLVASAWGWEHHSTWVNPYFPCHPSDGEFMSLVSDLAADGVYLFPWPSGYHRSLTFRKRPDGTFEQDWRGEFNREAAKHACIKRDGKIWEVVRDNGWLYGGSMAALCGGEEWTQRWLNEDVVGGLARRGCRVVQADQINGGDFPACWNRGHGHPPGEGRWKTEATRRQMKGMIDAIRKVHGEGAAAYEEPSEQFNDLVGLQLLRDTRPKTEWASLYGYLYHEYVPMFQPNPRRGGLRWMAYSAVEGHMPRFVPDLRDFRRGGPAMPEGFLVGPFGGGGGKNFHTGENIPLDDALFTPGKRFRISMTCRTIARPGEHRIGMHYGVYTPEYKALARGGIDFPKKESDGTRTLVSEFTMPEGNAAVLRVMLNASAEAKGEVVKMKLEVVNPDGTVSEAREKGSVWYDGYMRRWTSLYHGEGRPWLAHGRRVKPPRLVCASTDVSGRREPAVFVAAYESLDGRRALALSNATVENQEVRCVFPDGSVKTYSLRPRELRLVR